MSSISGTPTAAPSAVQPPGGPIAASRSAEATVLPDADPAYLGFAPLSLTTRLLGLSGPANAGDTSAIIAETLFALEQTSDRARANDIGQQGGARRAAFGTIADHAARMAALEAAIRADQAEKAETAGLRDSKQQTLSGKAGDLGSQTAELQRLDSRVAILDQSIAGLDRQIAAATTPAERSALEQQRQSLAAERTALQSARPGVVSRIDALQTEIRALEAEIAELSARIDTLTTRIALNEATRSFLVVSLLNAILSLVSVLAVGDQQQAETAIRNGRQDVQADGRFEINGEIAIEIDRILADAALAADIRLDKDREVADARRIVLPALSLAAGFMVVLDALKAVADLEDDVDDDRGRRLRLDV